MTALSQAYQDVVDGRITLRDYHYIVLFSPLYFLLDGRKDHTAPLVFQKKDAGDYCPVFDTPEKAQEALMADTTVAQLRGRDLIALLDPACDMVLNAYSDDWVRYAHDADMITMRNISEQLDFAMAQAGDKIDTLTNIDTYLPYEQDHATIALIQKELAAHEGRFSHAAMYRQDDRNTQTGQLKKRWDLLLLISDHPDPAALKDTLTAAFAVLGEKAPHISIHRPDDTHPYVRMAQQCRRPLWPPQSA